MIEYVELLHNIITDGEERHDRTGVGTKSIFGGQLTFDLRERFPLVTIKKTLWKSSFIEMLWFLRGEANTSFLKKHDVNIWDPWADKDGNLGPVYGVQWRHWPGKVKNIEMGVIGVTRVMQDEVDQIKLLINGIIKDPTGRRHIVTAWNPGFISEMGLPPCHRDFQCYASGDNHLDMMVAIRSWDTGLGAPFNIAQYGLLLTLIARATKREPRYLKINYGDAHIYLNHLEPLTKMIQERQPINCQPKLIVKTDSVDIDSYSPRDFDIEGYESHPFIKLDIAV